MAVRLADCVQRGHYFCIVDEVDSILIDEARTPLIISGVPEAATDTYYRFARIVPTLKKDEDYDVDEKHRAASPTESGVDKVEKALGIENLYLDVNGNLVNHLIQALKAHALYRKDKEYIVRDGELLIVDEFTGRVLEGRRYSEGLHQALEAKEGLRIREENQTLATITLQNYFRMYEKLSGMTGTASTEANEFAKIYNAEVTSIPTHKDMIRADENDYIFKTKEAKFRAVVEEIVEAHERGQPVLVGTISVEISEMLAGMLTRRGVQHNVLNAKNHAREAEIIQHAGQPGAVTIATNMAGRGVDIKLGEGVAEIGRALHRGHRAPREPPHRQPAPRPLGPPGRPGRLALLPVGRGRPHPHLRRRPHLQDPRPPRARRRPADRGEDAHQDRRGRPEEGRGAELQHPQARPRLRRRPQQAARGRLLGAPPGAGGRGPRRAGARLDRRDPRRGSSTSTATRTRCRPTGTSRRSSGRSRATTRSGFGLDDIRADLDDEADPLTREELLDRLEDDAMDAYERREGELGAELVRDLERWVLLQLIDQHWREHLYNMDYLREGIHLRALGQKDPLSEYRLEGHAMFDEMMDIVKTEFVRYMFHIQVDRAPEAEEQKVAERRLLVPVRPRPGLRGRGAPRPRAVEEAPRWSPSSAAAAWRSSSSGCCPTTRRWAATTPAPAAPARSTSAATAPEPSSRPDEHRLEPSLDDLVQRAAPPSREGRRPGRLPLTRPPSSAASPSWSARWARPASGTTRPAAARGLGASTPPPPAA